MAGHEHDADPRGALFERPVEVGANGQPTGVELELPPDEPERNTTRFDPADLGIETHTVPLQALLRRLRFGEIDLAADFHRRAGMWSDVQQSRFVESLLLGVPVPAFHMAQQEYDHWSVVIGMQEMTAVARFMESETQRLPQLRLVGLEYLTGLEGDAHEDLPGRGRVRLEETPVVVHLVRHTTPDAVKFNVFSRVSASGPQLASQEIRHAMVRGRGRLLLPALAEHPAFGRATGYSVSNERMADRELVLRYLAFRMSPPAVYRESDFEQFLTAAMRRLDQLSEKERTDAEVDFVRAMESARKLFGDQAFRRSLGHKRRLPVNKALFEAVAVNLAALDDHERDRMIASRDVVREVREGLYARLTRDFAFERSLTVAPGDPDNVRMRFDVVARLFQGVLSGD